MGKPCDGVGVRKSALVLCCSWILKGGMWKDSSWNLSSLEILNRSTVIRYLTAAVERSTVRGLTCGQRCHCLRSNPTSWSSKIWSWWLKAEQHFFRWLLLRLLTHVWRAGYPSGASTVSVFVEDLLHQVTFSLGSITATESDAKISRISQLSREYPLYCTSCHFVWDLVEEFLYVLSLSET